jgi:hypothetical protein
MGTSTGEDTTGYDAAFRAKANTCRRELYAVERHLGEKRERGEDAHAKIFSVDILH